jgi:DNA-binding transcriptional MocR family regulator
MLAALERELGARAGWNRPGGGYFLWAELPVETRPLLQRAEAAGLSFVAGGDFFPDRAGGERSARLAFSYESPSAIDEGISLLASLV